MIIKNLMDKWYLEKANTRFNKSLMQCWLKFSRFDLIKPKLSIKHMKMRWGSLSSNGTVTLNRDLIKAPVECIDYVVMHELCHLKYNDHSPDFYKLLDSVIPDWEKVKHKLELHMS